MRRLLSAAFCTAAMLGLSSTAEAVAILQLSTDPLFGAAQTLTISDNTSGVPDPTGDLNGAPDVILVAGTFEGFSYSFTSGTASELTDISDLLLSVQSVTRTPGGNFDTLYARFTRTDLDTPTGNPMNIGSSVGSTESGSSTGIGLAFRSFADPGNLQFGSAVSLPTQPCTFGGGITADCGGTISSTFNRDAGPFSLTNQLTIDLTAGSTLGNATGSTAVTATAVPEPGSLLLLASGLASAAAAARRRRSKRSQS